MGKDRISVQKITLIGVMAALSLGIYAIEAQVPSPNIAGIKLGLANVVTLCAMLFAGRIAAGFVLGIRIVLAAAFCGTFISFMFSLCGGFAAYAVMCLLVNNAGQLCVVAVVLTTQIGAFIPYLVISGIGSGALTGLVAQRLWFSPLRRFAVKK